MGLVWFVGKEDEMKKLVFVIATISSLLLIGCGSDVNRVTDPSTTPPNSPSASAGNVEYQKGILTDKNWESRFLDLRFTMPSGYVMATESEVRGMMEIAADVVNIDYSKLSTVYEMMATSFPSGHPNVIVMVEKLSLSNMTIEQYVAALKIQLSSITTMTYSFSSDLTDVTIAGHVYKQFSAECQANGMTILQNIILRKIDNRVAGLIVSYTESTKSEMEILMKGFSKY